MEQTVDQQPTQEAGTAITMCAVRTGPARREKTMNGFNLILAGIGLRLVVAAAMSGLLWTLFVVVVS